MSVTLIEKLKGLKMTTFEWISFEKKVTADESGERMTYLVFTLSEAIPMVTGSQRIYSPDRSKSAHLTAVDVTQVEVNLDVIAKYESEFSFDEDAKGELIGTGKYSGDLRLDVSQNDRVWLVDVPLSKSSSDWKTKRRNDRIESLIAANQERMNGKS